MSSERCRVLCRCGVRLDVIRWNDAGRPFPGATPGNHRRSEAVDHGDGPFDLDAVVAAHSTQHAVSSSNLARGAAVTYQCRCGFAPTVSYERLVEAVRQRVRADGSSIVLGIDLAA